MIPVSSSNLRAVDYNPLDGTLIIQFHSGHVYEYYDVPQFVFESLLSAPSKGKYHHRHIKYSFNYRRVH